MQQNINLYTYYDKSLAEIHKGYLDSLANKKVVVKTNKKPIIIAASVVFLLVVGVGTFFYMNATAKRNTVLTSSTSSKPDLRSTEEKLGYVSVQIFEFAEEEPTVAADKGSQLALKISELVAAAPEKAPERDNAYTEKQKELDAIKDAPVKQVAVPRPIEKPKVVEKPKEPERVAPVVVEKRYSIVFENVSQQQFSTLQKMGVQFSLAPNVADSYTETKTIWRVYRVDPKGKIKIGGKNVELVKDFNLKEDALQYARDNNIQSVIRSEDLSDKFYTVRFCCTKLDNAKELAQASNIRDKAIKIIREK